MKAKIVMPTDQAIVVGRRLTCDVCGHDYPIWFTPKTVWGVGEVEGASAKCPSCFADEYEAATGRSLRAMFI